MRPIALDTNTYVGFKRGEASCVEVIRKADKCTNMLLCAFCPTMRTTVELPDPLFRELKARAAFEGRSLKALMLELLERGLRQPPKIDAPVARSRSQLPSISTGAPFPLVTPGNADLFELLDADS